MAFVIDRSLYLSPEVVGEPRRSAPLEVKEDPFSLEALVAWLEGQNPATDYPYFDSKNCLLGQYVASLGGSYQKPVYRVGKYELASTHDNEEGDLHRVAYYHSGLDTFGAALERAKALLAEREK